MDFVFADQKEYDPKCLMQGDILAQTPALQGVLREAHSYYADAYSFFVVVTQSCDLVRRGKKPKARYISIAAVRSLRLVVERHLAACEVVHNQTPLGIYRSTERVRTEQMLERLINNEEKGFFFLRRDSHPSIKEDMVAFLALSVALKADHYDALLAAKVAQLDPLFSAKLGWLVGNMYSRVATPDLEEKGRGAEKKAFLDEWLGPITWVSNLRARALTKRLGKRTDISPAMAASELDDVPGDMEMLADRVAELARPIIGAPKDDPKIEELRKVILNDEHLKSLARGVAQSTAFSRT